MNKNIFAVILLLSLGGINLSAFAGSNYSYTQNQYQQPVYNNNQYGNQAMPYNNVPLQGNVVMVPSGTKFPAMLTTGLSSETSTVGQGVSMVLGSDFYYNNQLIAPAGSTVTGSVIQASKAKHGSMNGKLAVRFTQIFTPYGTAIPISAVISTNDSSGVLKGGTKADVAKDYTKDLVAGSAAGALSGVVFGALAGGKVGRGAALGTAVGAGGGLIKSIWDKGDDVEIPANSNIEILLTQPLTVSASNLNANSFNQAPQQHDVTNYSFEN